MKIYNLFFLVVLFSTSSCGFYNGKNINDCSECSSNNAYYNRYVEIASKENLSNERLPRPELGLNDDIKRELNYFLKQDRKFILNSLNNKRKFEPMILKVFDDHGVPGELATVALIESKYEPNAVSRSGAAGMWQFMKATGEDYGLSINYSNDERHDPVLSTIAAAKHLKDLYVKYNDWFLALAAYNAGIGTVNKTMNKANSSDFWEIKKLFREQTQRYVARFVAVNIILQDLDYWGFKME
ncbi:MAG: lytic transglycosylase domain-containing protein [Bdellovibrionota bacterium]